MILEKQKESIILQEGAINSSTKMSLDLDSAQILMDMLSKNLYSDSIGSTIRECASNALDSHRKSGTDKPIIVSFNVNKQNNYEFSVEDFGTGLDDNDIVNIISKYGKSTKRQDANSLGMMGLGFKSPLAYTSSFYFVCRKSGVERKYMMYEGEDVATIDLLYERPTKEENGVKVIVPVNYSDKGSFVLKIKEQLCYFENVYFNVDGIQMYGDQYNKIDNDFIIFRAESFQFSELNRDDNMHICLDNVYYPMDFAKLGIPIINCPIGLRFTLSDGVFPTPNRESLRYTKEAIDTILKKLQEVANAFVMKYNSTVDLENCTIFSIIDYYKDSSRNVLLPNQKTYNAAQLEKYATISYNVPKLEGIKLLNLKTVTDSKLEYLLATFELKFKLSAGRMSDMTKSSYDCHFRTTTLKFPSNFVYVYKDRISGIKKDYLRTIAKSNEKHMLVRKVSYARSLGNISKFNFYNYIHLLDLKNYPKNQWREVIKEWQHLESLISVNFIDLDKFEVPDEYLQSRKKAKIINPITGAVTARRIKLQGEVVGKEACKLARYNGDRNCKFVAETYKLQEFERFKGITVYAKHDDYMKLDELYGVTSEQKMRIVTFSDREMKILEKTDIHNLITFEKFMEGKNSHFKRLVTSYLMSKLVSDYNYTFSMKHSFKNISLKFAEKLIKIKDYVDNNYANENNSVYKAMVEVAEQHQLYDMTSYPEYLEMKNTLTSLPFIEPLSNEVRVVVNNNTIMYSVYADLFKYYGHKVNLEHYKQKHVEEPIVEEEEEELVEEL